MPEVRLVILTKITVQNGLIIDDINGDSKLDGGKSTSPQSYTKNDRDWKKSGSSKGSTYQLYV